MSRAEELDHEARDLVAAGDAHGVPLRTVGGVGVRQRLDDLQRARFDAVRPTPRDIDLLAPTGTSSAIQGVFGERGYVADERLIAWRGNQRQRYFRVDDAGEPIAEIDVFLGVPPLCHPIDFGDRFGFGGPAMPATDLLLQKLQIVEANGKDLVDVCLLLASHPQGDDEERAISAARVADLLSRDWGFHYTAMLNLEKVEAVRADTLPDEGAAESVRDRLTQLRETIDSTPKTRRWKMRAKVGTRVQWYEEVEEVDR